MRIWGTIFAVWGVLLWSAASFAADTAHHVAKVHIDPAKPGLLVNATVELKGGGATDFRLSTAMTLDTVTLNGKPVSPLRRKGVFTIDLGANASHTVALTYQGTGEPFLGLEGGFVDNDWLAHPEGRLATWSIEGQIPTTPKADDEDTGDKNVGGQKFIVPGKLMFETTSDGHYRAGYQNFNASAPPVLITGPFQIGEKILKSDQGDVRIRTYFHKELAGLSDTYLEDTARYIAYYIGKIGPYPYPGFAVISGPAPVGWGLPGMTYMGRRVLALPFIRFTSLPHEVLHNWWGNAVEVDYATGNWAEGLTTYQADHAMAERMRAGGGREKRLEWLRNYAALPSERDQPLTEFRAKTHDASQVVGYGKTAFVFHMLKQKLGEAVFDKAIQRFNRDNHMGIAGWKDVRTAFEAESGQELGSFFYAWVEKSGAPVLKIRDAKATEREITLTVEQDQRGTPYPLHLPISVETAKGTERHVVKMNKKRQHFTIATKTKAQALRLDPDLDVFRRLGPGEAPPILRDVTLDSDAKLVTLGSMEMRAYARELAGRLLQARLRMQDPADPAKSVIIAGPKAFVREHLDRSGLLPPPKAIADQGDARAWTARNGEQTLLIVEAENAEGFAALTRVLPHYKRRSFVVMELGKTVDKGTWNPTGEALTVKFD